MTTAQMIQEIFKLFGFLIYVIMGAFFISKVFMYASNDDNELYKDKAMPIVLMSILLCMVDYYFYMNTNMFMFLLHIIPILQIQRYSDVKTKTVYTIVNRLLVLIAITDVLLFGYFNKSFLIAIGIEILVLYFMYLRGKFGSGDYYVMIAIAIITQILVRPSNIALFGIINFLFFILISNISVLIKGLIISKKEHKKLNEIRIAFYPYMELGFFAATISAALNI